MFILPHQSGQLLNMCVCVCVCVCACVRELKHLLTYYSTLAYTVDGIIQTCHQMFAPLGDLQIGVAGTSLHPNFRLAAALWDSS